MFIYDRAWLSWGSWENVKIQLLTNQLGYNRVQYVTRGLMHSCSHTHAHAASLNARWTVAWWGHNEEHFLKQNVSVSLKKKKKKSTEIESFIFCPFWSFPVNQYKIRVLFLAKDWKEKDRKKKKKERKKLRKKVRNSNILKRYSVFSKHIKLRKTKAVWFKNWEYKLTIHKGCRWTLRGIKTSLAARLTPTLSGRMETVNRDTQEFVVVV